MKISFAVTARPAAQAGCLFNQVYEKIVRSKRGSKKSSAKRRSSISTAVKPEKTEPKFSSVSRLSVSSNSSVDVKKKPVKVNVDPPAEPPKRKETPPTRRRRTRESPPTRYKTPLSEDDRDSPDYVTPPSSQLGDVSPQSDRRKRRVPFSPMNSPIRKRMRPVARKQSYPSPPPIPTINYEDLSADDFVLKVDPDVIGSAVLSEQPYPEVTNWDLNQILNGLHYDMSNINHMLSMGAVNLEEDVENVIPHF